MNDPPDDHVEDPEPLPGTGRLRQEQVRQWSGQTDRQRQCRSVAEQQQPHRNQRIFPETGRAVEYENSAPERFCTGVEFGECMLIQHFFNSRGATNTPKGWR